MDNIPRNNISIRIVGKNVGDSLFSSISKNIVNYNFMIYCYIQDIFLSFHREFIGLFTVFFFFSEIRLHKSFECES